MYCCSVLGNSECEGCWGVFILSLEVVKVVVVILVESVCFDVVGVELVWFLEDYV